MKDTATLIRDLDSRLGWKRKAAARRLAEHPTPEVLKALERTLESDDWEEVRRTAVRSLARHSERAVAVLGRALWDPSPGVREEVSQSLGEIGTESVFPHLLRASRDVELEVRSAAVAAIGKIDSPWSVSYLCDVLEEAELGTCIAAAVALMPTPMQCRTELSSALEPLARCAERWPQCAQIFQRVRESIYRSTRNDLPIAAAPGDFPTNLPRPASATEHAAKTLPRPGTSPDA